MDALQSKGVFILVAGNEKLFIFYTFKIICT